MYTFIRNNKRLILSVGAVALWMTTITTATITPTTLDPNCTPTDPGCFVDTMQTRNINIVGNSITVAAPASPLTVDFTYGTVSGYPDQGFYHDYRVYAYKNTPAGRVYSATYASIPAGVVDAGTNTDVYTVTVSWNPVSGADGYRVIKSNYNTINGYSYYGNQAYDYNAGYDTTSTTFTDDGCGTVCFDLANQAPTITTGYSNTHTINGVLTLNGSLRLHAGNYINFSTTGGTDGYGFRDNAGTLQYKNSGGSWEAFSSGVELNGGGGFVVGNGAITTYSNFIGLNAGLGVDSISASNFFGYNAGSGATNASQSNFFGNSAGDSATNASNSNFLGQNAGAGATNALHSNFLGNSAGQNASNAEYSNFFGDNAGFQAVNAFHSNFLGNQAGSVATHAPYSNFFGSGAGSGATHAPYSNFFGSGAGSGATFANNSNFLGQGAGTSATSANNSNFLGQSAGNSATNAVNSNFLGSNAGNGATNAYGSNFIGQQAGGNASNAPNSNFIGPIAGLNATNASYSNFFGVVAGLNATNATYSNFIGGESTGSGATNASYSNFFGAFAGQGATNASKSNLFGFRTGMFFSGNNIGSNNIIIGTNISLPDATANAINLGGVLFGTGTYSTTTGNPSITPISGGRIGIGVVSPAYTLQVGNSGVSGIVARFQNSTGTCDINPTTTALSCSSDRTLKKNITALDTYTTSKFLSLAPVQYNWNIDADTAPKQTGFIAQDVEALFPDLVTTDKDTGLKSLNYIGLIPYTIAALKDVDIKVASIIPEALDATAYGKIKEFLRGIAVEGKGVFDIVQSRLVDTGTVRTETLCIGPKGTETCFTQQDIQNLIQRSGSQGETPVSTTPPPSTEELVPQTNDTPSEQPETTTE